MKRKIKITSKMIKKTVLWAILVVLVVGLGIIVVQSFDSGHILSNNTKLQDVDYSDEYRLYLEKQLVAKSKEGDYDTIISNRIVEERERTEIAQAKALEDLKDSISEEEKKEAQDKVAELEKALESGDLELIKAKKDELEKVVQALATKVYQQAQAAQQAQGGAEANGSKPDDVVDADYTEN